MGKISKLYFAQKAEALIQKAGSRCPFEIADELGIIVMFRSDLGNLKGMYTIIKRNAFIFINSNLTDLMKKIVCAHELGHHTIHPHLAKGGAFKEFMLYEMDSKPEYEANIFAAELLLDTDELLDYIYDYNYSDEQIAMAMGTDVNLVALKVGYLRELGYDLKPSDHKSDFLK